MSEVLDNLLTNQDQNLEMHSHQVNLKVKTRHLYVSITHNMDPMHANVLVPANLPHSSAALPAMFRENRQSVVWRGNS